MVKEECKEVSVSSKRLAKKERHFEIKTNIKEISLLRQPPHFLLCKKTLVSIATSLRLEFIPQVKELLDEGLVRKRLNPCALLVPKISIIRHQIPKIGGVMNALGGATLFCKITCAPNIFMICVHRDSLGRCVLIFSFNTNLGTHMGHLRFVILFGRNNQHENTEKGVPMNPKRIKVIPEWPAPPSVRKIWGFQDLTNFYKRFAPYFSILVAPLIELVRNHVPSWEDAQEMSFQTLPYFNILNTTNTYGEGMMQSYPARALDRKLQVDWARDAREGPRSTKFRALLSLSLHSSPSSSKLLSMASYGGHWIEKLQVDWARDAREGPRVLMSLRTHLLLEVASPLSLPSPFRCHLSSKKQRNPLMKKILGLQAPMELASCEEGQPLMVKEECKEVSVSSKRLAKKERHFEIKTNIKEISLLRQPPHFLLCKKTLVSIATSLRLEFIPQVKELLDEGLVRKRLNPCALLVPKIGIIRHQIPKIGGVMNALGGATLFCKITHAPNIFMIGVHRDSLGRFVLIFSFNTNLGTHMGHLRFVILFGRNNQHENTEKGVKGRSPEYQEPQDLSGVSSLSSFSIPLPFIFQEAKESIDEEDPRPTSSNGACIRGSPSVWAQEP
ncbi:putative mitochondrial protein [Glycine soja]